MLNTTAREVDESCLKTFILVSHDPKIQRNIVIDLTFRIILGGGPKVHFSFKLVHLAMFLNQIFMLNPKIITIFPYIHFLAGYFMLFNFSDSYKKNVES